MKFQDYLITNISYLKNKNKRETIDIAKQFSGLKGIEIGGPSAIFSLKGIFPVYLYAGIIDGVNFSEQTVWEGSIHKGNTYQYYKNKQNGYQYIDEASVLSTVPDGHYDFLLSSHCLEHIANPIVALKNWLRVLKPKAKICLVLPDKNYTFDVQRPYTSFEHLLNDYKNDVQETDSTHFTEVIEMHDFTKEKTSLSKDEFKCRTWNNFENRCVHHHVFNFETINTMLEFCDCDVLLNKQFSPFHLLSIAQKRS